MIIPMLCVTIFVILVVWFLLPRVARLMIHTPTAISIFVCLSMVQLMAVFISMRCTLCGHFLQVSLTLILVVGDRKSGSAGMPRPISYAVFCLKKIKHAVGILSGSRTARVPVPVPEYVDSMDGERGAPTRGAEAALRLRCSTSASA